MRQVFPAQPGRSFSAPTAAPPESAPRGTPPARRRRCHGRNAYGVEAGRDAADTVKVAVCGAHLSGLPLNWQLTQRGARLLGAVQSAPKYKFYALAGGPVQRPGIVRVAEGGAAIDMEVWELLAEHFGSIVDGIPAPLGIGKVKLADGTWVSGFVCEAIGVEDGTEITQLGSWRGWLAQKG
ncbi:hypothetical protein ACFQNJ_14250 [Hydrogenophaga bisanensis]|uniref:Allophanate hydrolase C-terminal domain-containing protein n=1 Tax=Hydrogenophaga bisanensis TaxID=439611 RepID=A0ABW2RCI6_9BURK